MGGAQNGTYMVNPKHMNVDYPSNVDDIAITTDGNYAQPEEIATEMTFFRFRCRGTSLFREVVDAAWEVGSDVKDLPYETVLHFDKKFQEITAEFDNVFDKYRNVLKIVQTSDPRMQTRNSLSIHWAMAHFCMDSRIARLHRPYLVRGAKDSKYAYSRMVCLRSARNIMELGNTILTSSKSLIAFKLWAIHHHMYVATVILVMDYCFNRNEPRAKARREEIMECFRAVKKNHNGSSTTPPGLLALEKILWDANGHSDNGDIYDKSWTGTADSSKQSYKVFPKSLTEQSTSNMALATDPSILAVRGNDFTDALSQQPWGDFDLDSFENIEFDSNLDANFFDELFQSLENSNDLI
jgi:hypothetical protein